MAWMASNRSAQLNVRSNFLRRRVPELTAQTGMTATQILEEAVRAYTPQLLAKEHAGLARRGWLLVGRSYNRQPVTLEQANADLETIRSGERD